MRQCCCGTILQVVYGMWHTFSSVPEEKVCHIPYTTCKMVPQQHCRMITCRRCYTVPEEKVCHIPYTTCKMVAQQHCKMIPQRRCYTVPEEKVCYIPYT